MREPTERLIEHYKQHGYPQDIAGPLDEGDIRSDIRTFVHNRIAKLTEVDPFYLDDPRKTELQIVGSMANRLGMQSKTPLEDIPPTEGESDFFKDIKENPLPEKLEELEKYLARYNLPKKEALSPKIRMRIMRVIMSHYTSDAETFFKALTSPIVQKYLSGDEYKFMEKHIGIEMRGQLSALLRANMNKATLPQEVGMMLMQDAIQVQDEKSVMMFFDIYPNVDTVNSILNVPGEKRNIFIVKIVSQLIPRLSPEENSNVNWKLVFEKITEPSVYFAKLANRIPVDLGVADAWAAIIDATIAQKNEEYIQAILSIAPAYGLPSAAFTKLMRAAHVE